MSDGTFRGRWIDEVYRTPLVSAEVKVLLLAMGHRDMGEDGRVSIPREELAGLLGCHSRKVTEKQATAIEAGLLVRVSSGGRGRHAVFQGAIPAEGKGADVRHPNDGIGGRPSAPYEEDGVPTVGTPTTGKGADSRHPNGGKSGRQSAAYRGDRVPTTSTLSQQDGVPTDGPLSTGKGADSRPPNSSRIYEARARAHSNGDRSEETADVSARKDERKKVSQSAQAREATRWLHARYGLTDSEAAQVIEEARRRAPTPIRSLVRYLNSMTEDADGMTKGDLADIVAAAQESPAAEPQADKPHIRAVPDWCRNCDHPNTRFVELPDGRVTYCPTCNPENLREAS